MTQYISINSQGVSTSQNTANAETDLVTYDVPREVARRIKRNPPLQFYVPVREDFDGDGTQQTFSLSHNMVDVPNKSVDTVVYDTDKGARLDHTPDYANDEISLDEASNNGTGNVLVYFIPATGNTFKFVVYDNQERNRNDVVFKSLDRSLFTQDQFDNSEAKRLDRNVQMIEDMVLAIRVNSSYQYSVDSRIVDELLVLEIPTDKETLGNISDQSQVRKTLGKTG